LPPQALVDHIKDELIRQRTVESQIRIVHDSHQENRP